MLHLTVQIHGHLRSYSSLMRENNPVAVAGCPPDDFSATGQLWGNPLYNWEYHKKTEYDWWIEENRVIVSNYMM